MAMLLDSYLRGAWYPAPFYCAPLSGALRVSLNWVGPRERYIRSDPV